MGCTKGLGLCHGIPGNGYALLVLYRETKNTVWLHRAQHFAATAADNREELEPLADRPYSLFEGTAGAVCFWSETLCVSSALMQKVQKRFGSHATSFDFVNV